MNTQKFIPKAMEKLNNWCYWTVDKIPKNCKNPQYGAKSNDPTTWCDIEYARDNFKKSGCAGIGFFLPLEGTITMIDLDHCVDNGIPNQFAQEIINMFPNTYIELSQSGTGIHILCYGKVKQSLHIDKIEIYSAYRYCATTGKAIQAKELADYQTAINTLYEKYKKPIQVDQRSIARDTLGMTTLQIVEVIRQSKNADKFDYYYKQAEANSENTLGLASILAFYCQNDRNKMKEIIKSSAMNREKLDRPTKGRTWLDYVIDTAISSTTEVYNPKLKNEYKENIIKQNIEKLETNEFENCFETASQIKKVDESTLKLVKSNFIELDKKIRGFIFGEISVCSGLNGSGKSNLLLQLLLNFALQGYKTMLFSGEMQDFVINNTLSRMVAGAKNLKPSKDETYYYIYNDQLKEKIIKWLDDKFYLYKNSCSMKAEDLISAIRYIVKKGVRIIILDNLMTINLRDYDKDKYEAQSMFVKDLANLCKELQIHIFVVMHPRKSMGFLRKEDISGTADLTNAVDNVFILHRNNIDFRNRSKEVIDQNTSNPDTRTGLYQFDNILEVCKNRQYGIQDYFVGLYYEKETRKFLNQRNEHYGLLFDSEDWLPF